MISAVVSGTTVTLSGNGTLAEYRTAIRAITFDNTAANPITTTRLIDVTVNDGTYDSNTARASITIVSPNDAPIAVNDTVNTNAGVPITFDARANDSDPEAQPLSVTQINGTNIAIGGTATLAGIGTVTRNTDGTLTFTPTAGFSGSSSFTYTLSDGVVTSTGTVSLSVNAPPAIDLDLSGAGTGFATTFTELGAAVAVVDTDVTITDANAGDSITFATVSILNAQVGDVLSVSGALPAGITASVVGDVLTLSGTASRANYQTALQAVRFGNPGSTAAATRTIQVLAYDGQSYSNAAYTTVAVTATNDAPVNAVPGHADRLRGHAARDHRRVGIGRRQQPRDVAHHRHQRHRGGEPRRRRDDLGRHQRHRHVHAVGHAGADQRRALDAHLHVDGKLHRHGDHPGAVDRRQCGDRHRHVQHQRRRTERRAIRHEQDHRR